MKHVKVCEVGNRKSPATIKRAVGDTLGIEGFALNYFELEPRETFSNTLHTHFDQEEVFYVLEGTATFETDEGQFSVDAGEVVRFEPGEYQKGSNSTDERVVAIVLGAPKESQEASLECPSCGARESPDVERTDDAVIFECAACGNEINRMT